MILRVNFFRVALIAASLNAILTFCQRAILKQTELSSAVSDFVSSASLAEYVLFVLLISVVIPVGEEIIFRGLLWKFVKKFASESKVAWFVAVLFAFVHPLESAFFLFPFSVYLSHLRYTTESVRAGIVAHIAFNTAGLVFPSVVNWILT